MYLTYGTKLFKINNFDFIGNSTSGSFGALDEFSATILKKVLNGESVSSDEYQQLAPLIDNNYISDINYTLTSTENLNINKIYFHITNSCNLNCVGCYSNDFCKNSNYKDIIRDNAFFNLLEVLRPNELIISGGEPLLYPNLEDFLKNCKKYNNNLFIRLITNGTILSDNLPVLLNYVDELVISFDSFDNEHCFLRPKGLNNKIIKFVKHVKEIGFTNIIGSVTLAKSNTDYKKEYKAFFEQLNIDFKYSPLICQKNYSTKDIYLDGTSYNNFIGDTNYNFEIAKESIYKLSFDNNCGFGCSTLSIDSSGNVFPCYMFHYDVAKITNIIINPLNKVIEDLNNYENIINDIDKIDGCSSCEYRYFCHGGCRVRAYIEYNSFNKPDPFCKTYKKNFENMFSCFLSPFLELKK